MLDSDMYLMKYRAINPHKTLALYLLNFPRIQIDNKF